MVACGNNMCASPILQHAPNISQHPGLSNLRCLQVIIFLVLLVAWMEDPGDITVKQDVGRIAKVADYSGYSAVGFDMVDGVAKAKQTGRRNPLDLNSNAGLVLAIKLVLRSRFNACVAFFAILCSSFVPVNRGTGSRDLLVPEGDENVVSVRKSNKLLSRNLGLVKRISTKNGPVLISMRCFPWVGFYDNLSFSHPIVAAMLRTCLLMLLIICAGGTFGMENPANSLVALQGRFVWLVKLLEKSGIWDACFTFMVDGYYW